MSFFIWFVVGILFYAGFVWLNRWFDDKCLEATLLGREIERTRIKSSLSHTERLGNRVMELETAMREFADALVSGENVNPWYYAHMGEQDDKWVKTWKDVLNVK